ncbi:hypothetical protein N657DRAFT_649032 [Parathielavia appendiculata]|uniref:Large ribosomal subunit protein mL49 n=1 Tax=Parathielavia appendiculata TaxID=2587402 RepID=A0AAN6Z0M9_9PEZI|nr:hypothetical protein N657DRAFT_649032 [Parathielavia appendiculata]
MLRPATVVRPFTAPMRLLTAQSTPATLLTRRYLATTSTQTPSPSEPLVTPTPTTQPPSEASSASTSPQFQNQQQPQLQQHQTCQPRKQPLPYRVSRTPSNNLAVYELAKRGGNKLLTTIKKVEGDRAAFRTELARGLGLAEVDDKGRKTVVVNTLTGHVIVAGHRKNQVVEWLEKQGF